MSESLVKVAKKTLKAVVGNAGLTDDELQAAMKEEEPLMNSIPLAYEGTDPRDKPVLTPNHFLVKQLGGQLAPQVADDIAFNPRNGGEKSFCQLLTREKNGERQKTI